MRKSCGHWCQWHFLCYPHCPQIYCFSTYGYKCFSLLSDHPAQESFHLNLKNYDQFCTTFCSSSSSSLSSWSPEYCTVMNASSPFQSALLQWCWENQNISSLQQSCDLNYREFKQDLYFYRHKPKPAPHGMKCLETLTWVYPHFYQVKYIRAGKCLFSHGNTFGAPNNVGIFQLTGLQFHCFKSRCNLFNTCGSKLSQNKTYIQKCVAPVLTFVSLLLNVKMSYI